MSSEEFTARFLSNLSLLLYAAWGGLFIGFCAGLFIGWLLFGG